MKDMLINPLLIFMHNNHFNTGIHVAAVLCKDTEYTFNVCFDYTVKDGKEKIIIFKEGTGKYFGQYKILSVIHLQEIPISKFL